MSGGTVPCARTPELFKLTSRTTVAMERAAIWLCERRCPILVECAARTPERGYITAGKVVPASTKKPRPASPAVGADVAATSARKCKICGGHVPRGRRTQCGEARCRKLAHAKPSPPEPTPEEIAEEVARAFAGTTFWGDLSRAARQGAVRELHAAGLADPQIARRLGARTHSIRTVRLPQLGLPGLRGGKPAFESKENHG